jgi:hypothetical protein
MRSHTIQWQILFTGSQNDIFLKKGTANSTYIPPSPTYTSSSFSIHEAFTNAFVKLFFIWIVARLFLI